MAVTAPADRRFRRAHLRPARKRNRLTSKRWRAAILLAVTALTVYAGYRTLAVAAELDMFNIDQINVRGNHRLSHEEVVAMLQNLRGRSVLGIDLADARRTLMSSPWVADASLRRTLPSTLDVAILERAPLGIGRINGALFLVDDRGSVIDEYGPNYADLDLPIIDGLAAHGRADDREAGTTPAAAPAEEGANAYRALLARRLLDALRGRNMAAQISQIDVSDARNAVVLLDGDSTLIRLGDERFAERLQSYFDLVSALRERVPAIDYVDLRFDERVYVRPARERGTPSVGTKRPPAKIGRPTQTG